MDDLWIMVLSILNSTWLLCNWQIVDSIGIFPAGHYPHWWSLVHSCTSQLLIDLFELQRGCVKRVLCSLVHQRQQSIYSCQRGEGVPGGGDTDLQIVPSMPLRGWVCCPIRAQLYSWTSNAFWVVTHFFEENVICCQRWRNLAAREDATKRSESQTCVHREGAGKTHVWV